MQHRHSGFKNKIIQNSLLTLCVLSFTQVYKERSLYMREWKKRKRLVNIPG